MTEPNASRGDSERSASADESGRQRNPGGGTEGRAWGNNTRACNPGRVLILTVEG